MGRGRMNPLHGFTDVVSEWNRMRHLGAYGYEPGQEGQRRTHATAWVPSTDVLARGRDLVIRVSLSGVRPEDVNITFSEGALTISGERRSQGDEEVSFYVRERYYGLFRRTMSLPPDIDGSKISADFENGMVEITVQGGATAAAVEPQRIEIRDRSR